MWSVTVLALGSKDGIALHNACKQIRHVHVMEGMEAGRKMSTLQLIMPSTLHENEKAKRKRIFCKEKKEKSRKISQPMDDDEKPIHHASSGHTIELTASHTIGK